MKKGISLLLSFIIVISAFITEIPVYAASNTAKDNALFEPITFIDNDGNSYSMKFFKEEKNKKILFFELKSFAFKIEMTLKKTDGTDIAYTYKTKDYYDFLFFAPKTLEKTMEKEKLTDIYNLWLDFQIKYNSWNFIKDIDNQKFFDKCCSELSNTAKERIKVNKENLLDTINDEISIKDNTKSFFENKIIDEFGIINPNDYISMVNDTNKFVEKIAEIFASFSSYSNTVDYLYSLIGPYGEKNFENYKTDLKIRTDEKVIALFNTIDKDAEKEDGKFKKGTTSCTKYTTQFAKANHITAPEFEFIYPSSWQITKEAFAVNTVTHIEEQLELTSANKAKITYMSLPKKLGGNGRKWIKAEAVEVAKSSFTPGYVQATDYSSLGEFVVAKIHETGFMLLDIDTDFQKIDNYYYAVIPKSYLGKMEYSDRLDGISFNYGGIYHQYLFIAESEDNKFTSEEEKEIIKILSSFK